MSTKKVKPIITAIRDAKGNNILQKPVLKLHYHPDTIKETIDKLIDNAPDPKTLALVEDVKTLLAWAFAHLKIKEYDEKEN